MKYRVMHTTVYQYESAVSVSHNHVTMSPRDSPWIRCRWHRLTIHPATNWTRKRSDYFGNLVHAFAIEQGHQQLTVTAASHVEVIPQCLPPLEESPAWDRLVADLDDGRDCDWLESSLYRFASPRIPCSRELADYGRASFQAGQPILVAAQALTRRIHEEFQYDPQATDVQTEVEQVLELRRGVCQDFAHLQVAILRSLGLPTRYVSGYLRTVPPPGRPRLVGADQSHAWVSLYCGQDIGWVDLDPTNDCFCGVDHVPIAWGRDYSDVMPFRGVFLGGGQHELKVSVDVCPLDSFPQ